MSSDGETSRLHRFLEFLPFLNGLTRLSARHFRGAGKEVLVTILLATFPLWAGAFYGALSDMKDVDGFWQAVCLYFSKLRKTLDNGTLILYSASLIAPVLYIALDERRDNSGRMPSPMSHILSVFVIQTAATIYFTKQMAAENMNSGFAFYTSLGMFLFTMFVLFIVHCHKHFDTSADPARAIEDTALTYASDYSRHRRGSE